MRGPEGAERDCRLAAAELRLDKPSSSELGNVSPVAIVPLSHTDGELRFQARNVATTVVNSGSFTWKASTMIITSLACHSREPFEAP